MEKLARETSWVDDRDHREIVEVIKNSQISVAKADRGREEKPAGETAWSDDSTRAASTASLGQHGVSTVMIISKLKNTWSLFITIIFKFIFSPRSLSLSLSSV